VVSPTDMTSMRVCVSYRVLRHAEMKPNTLACLRRAVPGNTCVSSADVFRPHMYLIPLYWNL